MPASWEWQGVKLGRPEAASLSLDGYPVSCAPKAASGVSSSASLGSRLCRSSCALLGDSSLLQLSSWLKMSVASY